MITKFIFLFMLYRDLSAHKKMNSFIDFKIRWNYYIIYTKDREIKYTIDRKVGRL